MEVLTAEGVNSFKFFLAYKGALMVTDDQLVHGLTQCKRVGALAQVRPSPPATPRVCDELAATATEGQVCQSSHRNSLFLRRLESHLWRVRFSGSNHMQCSQSQAEV
jgi:hypothetical protein